MAEDFRAIFEGFFPPKKNQVMRLWQILYIYIYIMDVRDPHEETGSQTCGGLASLASLGRMPDWWHRLSRKRSMSFPMALLRKTRKMSRR